MKLVRSGLMLAVITAGTVLASGAMAGGMGGNGWHGDSDRTKAADTNGDGSLSRVELQTFERANAAALDLDRNGAVTVAEMKAFREAQRARHEAERLAALDSNKDGKVSVDEIATSRVDRSMRRDADGNGTLSADELSHRGHRRGHGQR